MTASNDEQQLRPYVIWHGRAWPEANVLTFGETRCVEAASGVLACDWPQSGAFAEQVLAFASVARVDPLLLSWDELTATRMDQFGFVDGLDEADALARFAAEYPGTPPLAADPASAALRGAPVGSEPREGR